MNNFGRQNFHNQIFEYSENKSKNIQIFIRASFSILNIFEF